jgi:hypothetical protein
LKNLYTIDFNKNSVSFTNRVNKVTRLIWKLIGDNNFILANITIKENKNKNNNNIEHNEISIIFQELDNCNSKEIILYLFY